MRIFIVLVLVGLAGVRGTAEQSRTTPNPCVQGGNQTPRLPPMDEAPSRPEFDRSSGGTLWSHVRLGDGRTGYIWHAYVRSPVDYRTLFNLSDGRWRMTAFVSGD